MKFSNAPQNHLKTLQYNHIDFAEELGLGAFATVRRAYYKGQEVAIKSIDNFKDFEYELTACKLLYPLHLPNMLQIHGYITHKQLIVMDYMRQGTLKAALKKQPHLCWIEKIQIISDLCRGLASLHQHDILHRDIKGANVLLDDNGRAVISDLGFVSQIKKNSTSIRGVTGSYRYMAPETHIQKQCTKKSDVFSLGLMIWCIASNSTEPYQSLNSDEAKAAILSHKEPGDTLPCPFGINEISERCRSYLAEDRPTATECLRLVNEAAVIATLSCIEEKAQSPRCKKALEQYKQRLASHYLEEKLSADEIHSGLTAEKVSADMFDLLVSLNEADVFWHFVSQYQLCKPHRFIIKNTHRWIDEAEDPLLLRNQMEQLSFTLMKSALPARIDFKSDEWTTLSEKASQKIALLQEKENEAALKKSHAGIRNYYSPCDRVTKLVFSFFYSKPGRLTVPINSNRIKFQY